MRRLIPLLCAAMLVCAADRPSWKEQAADWRKIAEQKDAQLALEHSPQFQAKIAADKAVAEMIATACGKKKKDQRLDTDPKTGDLVCVPASPKASQDESTQNGPASQPPAASQGEKEEPKK